MRTQTTLVVFVALLALACAPGIASADMIGPFSSSVASAKTDWSSNLVFPKFNPSLGTLTMVQFDLSSSLDTILTVKNTSAGNSSGWAKTEVVVTAQDAGGLMGNPQIDYLTSPYAFNLAAGQQVTSGHLLRNGSDSWQYMDSGILAAFTGAGSISLPAFTQTYAVISYTGGNTDASQVTNASALGKVTYFYDVPEPLTMSLLGLGSLALLGRRSRMGKN